METAKILIVEDHQYWRDMLTEILEHEGYTVESAANYEEASHALKTLGLQLVLMDLQLVEWDESNLSGLGLLAHIGMFNPCARAIVLTAHPKHEREAYQKYSGVFDYINKQKFDQADFMRVVRDAIHEASECEKGRKERPAYPDFV
jgi:DNA-binding NtrC family response regulator